MLGTTKTARHMLASRMFVIALVACSRGLFAEQNTGSAILPGWRNMCVSSPVPCICYLPFLHLPCAQAHAVADACKRAIAQDQSAAALQYCRGWCSVADVRSACTSGSGFSKVWRRDSVCAGLSWFVPQDRSDVRTVRPPTQCGAHCPFVWAASYMSEQSWTVKW